MKKLPFKIITLFIIVTLLIILPFLIWGGTIESWTAALIREGQTSPLRTGLILAAVLASDVIMPVPSCIASTACGLTLGLLRGTLASFAGMSISCLAGYALGRLFTPAATRMLGKEESEKLGEFQRHYGIWLVLSMRPVPVLAEASMLFVGITREPFGRTMAVASLGNLVVSLIYAAVGAFGRLQESTVTAFAVSVLLSGCLMLVSRRQKRTPRTSPRVPDQI